MHDGRQPLIEVRNLRCVFDLSAPLVERVLGGGERRYLNAVDDVSFSIDEGKTLALVGESGCGKSTVARCLVGLQKPTSGSIHFAGRSVATMSRQEVRQEFTRQVQMIFQDPYSSLNPRWKVFDIIAEPIRAFGMPFKGVELTNRIHQLMGYVGLTANDAERYPHEFSGGQRQRISIARALAGEPKFIVCDEPTSALDVSVQARVLNLLKDLQAEFGLTYLFISHNLATVYQASDEVIVMYLGRLCERDETERLFRAPVHPYTRMLLETVPSVRHPNRNRQPMDGEVPDPLDPPSGCPFHPRCDIAVPSCHQERPVFQQHGDRWSACHLADELKKSA